LWVSLSSFSLLEPEQAPLCHAPINIFVHGDLKFFAQVLGQNGMSSSWCMYCNLHPNQWKSLYVDQGCQSVEDHELWTLEEQNRLVEKITRKELKEVKQKKGIASDPLIPH
jgi:hypothetical protein